MFAVFLTLLVVASYPFYADAGKDKFKWESAIPSSAYAKDGSNAIFPYTNPQTNLPWKNVIFRFFFKKNMSDKDTTPIAEMGITGNDILVIPEYEQRLAFHKSVGVTLKSVTKADEGIYSMIVTTSSKKALDSSSIQLIVT